MQAALAALLLLTSTVVITCIVVNYAVAIIETTLQTSNLPQLDRLRNLQEALLNQTNALVNQTIPIMTNSTVP